MKRYIIFVPLIVSLSCAAYGQTSGVERQGHLNGPVQSVRIEIGDLIQMIGVGNSKPRVESRQRQLDYLYDLKGNLQESVRYSRGNVTRREVFKYDEKNRLVEEARYEPKESLVERTAHRYNAEGKEIESLRFDEKNKHAVKIVCEYDQAGRMIEKVSYLDREPNGKAVFAYDGEGRASGFMAYDSKGDVASQVVNLFDDKASRVQKSRYGSKGDLQGKTVTTCNTNGDAIAIDHFRPNGTPAWKWEFEYDDKGNVIKEMFSNKASLSVWTYSYEYDSMGNWTRKTKSQLVDDHGKITPVLSGVTYRSFKYYPQTSGVQRVASPEDRELVKDATLSMAASEIRPAGSGVALAGLSSGEPLGPARMSGTVQIEMTIDTEGNVESARVIAGRDVLARDPVEVEQKMKNRTFKPVLLNGVPVRVVDTLTIKFEVPKLGRGKW